MSNSKYIKVKHVLDEDSKEVDYYNISVVGNGHEQLLYTFDPQYWKDLIIRLRTLQLILEFPIEEVMDESIEARVPEEAAICSDDMMEAFR